MMYQITCDGKGDFYCGSESIMRQKVHSSNERDEDKQINNNNNNNNKICT